MIIHTLNKPEEAERSCKKKPKKIFCFEDFQWLTEDSLTTENDILKLRFQSETSHCKCQTWNVNKINPKIEQSYKDLRVEKFKLNYWATLAGTGPQSSTKYFFFFIFTFIYCCCGLLIDNETKSSPFWVKLILHTAETSSVFHQKVFRRLFQYQLQEWWQGRTRPLVALMLMTLQRTESLWLRMESSVFMFMFIEDH